MSRADASYAVTVVGAAVSQSDNGTTPRTGSVASEYSAVRGNSERLRNSPLPRSYSRVALNGANDRLPTYDSMARGLVHGGLRAGCE